LFSNLTDAEDVGDSNLTAFNSNGFTAGSGGNFNTSGQTYVGWQWRASNATAVTNTAGTITSQVSANTTSGFSIVTYTGQSGAGTVGHGLGVAPAMIIVKSRSNGAYGWAVWLSAFTQSEYLLLDTTDAKGTASNYWNSSAPSTWTSAFGVGSGPKYNNNTGDTFVAYCFAPIAGFSSFGTYTGNGSTDGPFVLTGFRPAFLIIKSASEAATNWYMWDSSRGAFNVNSQLLWTNLNLAEGSLAVDFLSNGFRIKFAGTGANTNGATQIYMAFAQNPFKYSLAR
jgi:hypothetical protein